MGLLPYTVTYIRENKIYVKNVFAPLEIPENVKYIQFRQAESSVLPVVDWETERTEVRILSAMRGHFSGTSRTFGDFDDE